MRSREKNKTKKTLMGGGGLFRVQNGQKNERNGIEREENGGAHRWCRLMEGKCSSRTRKLIDIYIQNERKCDVKRETLKMSLNTKQKNDRKPEKVKREKWIGGESVSSVMITRWRRGRFRRRFRPRLQTLKGVERCGRRTIARPVNLSCWGWSSLVLLLWRGTRWRCCRHCRRIQSLCHGFRLNRQHQSIGRLALSFPFFGRLTSVIEIPTFTFCFYFPTNGQSIIVFEINHRAV